MAGENGRGCQRTCTYLPNAAVAERSVTSHSGRPGRTELVLSVPALISRTAVYGPVCTVVWEGGAVRLLPIPIGFPSDYITIHISRSNIRCRIDKLFFQSKMLGAV